eukprot:TRINITY_DN1248_c0_g1_i1.p1 TRINITY_DN1248_c0_g1~~TRINITY_DN1248_c0_g1_i1.p1  ORF type:complete len:808 (+),score=458.86 TRINITY_DN1248_c0_g1_i1:240-2426(+)
MSNIKNTIGQVKRFIGRKFSEVADEITKVPFAVVEQPNDEIGFKVQYNSETLVISPTKIMAIMLVKLKQIQETEGGRMTDVVLSVPSWFNDRQRRALSDACEIAGINCLRFINENTASALGWGFYKLDLPEQGTPPIHVLFVDIGHSTTSASVVAFSKGKLKVLSTAFNHQLGGRNIDEKLVNFFAVEFNKKYGADARENPKSLVRLTTSCEKLKKDLCSGVSEARISIENLMNDLDVSSRMTRVDFEAMIEPELNGITKVITDAVAGSGITFEQLQAVEVVGGSKRMPAVQAAIRETVKRELNFTLNDVESVARGCAVMCAIASPGYKVKEFAVVDSQSYPIKLTWNALNKMDDAAPSSSILFPKGSFMPSSKLLKLSEPSQYELVATYDETAKDVLPANASLEIGSFLISQPPATTNDARIEVKMRVNNNGILSVESAEFVETYEVEEAAPAPAAPASPATPATPAEGEEAVAVPETPAEPTIKKKKRSKTTKLTVTETTPSLSTKDIQLAIEDEGSMQAQDKLVKETAEAKNAVESYCLDIRSRISGELKNYGTQKEKDELIQSSNEIENWLYEDGYDETKGIYSAKLVYLQGLGNVFLNRRNEEQKRLIVVADLRKGMNQILGALNDEKYSHIEQEDKDSIITEASVIEAWLAPLLEKQSGLTACDEPAVSSFEIFKKKTIFEENAKKILSKPKPVVVVPEPTAEAAAPAEGEASKKENEPMVD